MQSIAGLNVVQTVWCVLYLVGFAVALHQAEDVSFAQKFAYLVVGLSVGSWIVYEIVRLHVSPSSSDEWMTLLPRFMVLWVAFCTLVRKLLHPDGISSYALLVLYVVLVFSAGIGVLLNFL